MLTNLPLEAQLRLQHHINMVRACQDLNILQETLIESLIYGEEIRAKLIEYMIKYEQF